MASVPKLHHLLLLSIGLTLSSPNFFVHFHNLAKADDALINQQCRETDVPAACIQCIKSDPGSKKADKAADIAAIIITCLINHAEILEANMTNLAYSTPDKEFKDICQDCNKCYSEVKTKYLSAAMTELKNGDYDKANRLVVAALVNDQTVACKDNIESHESEVPDDVFYEMRIYEELTGAAMSIIDRLALQKP